MLKYTSIVVLCIFLVGLASAGDYGWIHGVINYHGSISNGMVWVVTSEGAVGDGIDDVQRGYLSATNEYTTGDLWGRTMMGDPGLAYLHICTIIENGDTLAYDEMVVYVYPDQTEYVTWDLP